MKYTIPLFALLLGAPAFAQDDAKEAPAPEVTETEAPEAEAEETEGEARTETGGAIDFAQAMEAMLLSDYNEAARLSYLALTKTKPSAEKYESAQYVLAEALEQVGLTLGAAEYFFSVAEQRQNPALLPRALAGLERLSRAGAIDEDRLVRGVLVEADLQNVPREISDFLHFYRGLSNLRLGYRRWADKELSAISSRGRYRERAEVVTAVTMVRDGKVEDAARIVEQLLGRTEESPYDWVVTDPRARDELLLMRARLLYERGLYDEAIEAYREAGGTLDTPTGEVLLERAWAHFMKGEDHDAMGLLYALDAPSNRELFLPEQFVLRGLIYQRFCHFLAAKQSVRDFRDRYGEAVETLLSGTPPVEIAAVAQAADQLPSVAPLAALSRRATQERERASELAGDLEEGGLGEHIEELYRMLERRAQALHQIARTRGADIVAEQLLEANEQANLLEYEVGVSIFKPIAEEGGDVELRAPPEKVPSGGRAIYYRFDDEFWSDELSDMRFLIQDRCVE